MVSRALAGPLLHSGPNVEDWVSKDCTIAGHVANGLGASPPRCIRLE